MTTNPHTIAVWWQAFRFHFVPPSFLPAILGAVVAWSIAGKFDHWYFIVTIIGVTINHIALNMTDDYYDYLHSVDQAKDREKNPYAGGSGTLTSGLLTPKQIATAFKICYIVTIILGLYLTVMRGWQVLIFGIFGIWCAYFYTAPPIRYGYRGFGELSQFINFSLTIGLGSYFVQAQSFSAEAFWTILPLGLMMFSMITINEIPDEKNDREGGKRNLVVLFGSKIAVWLYATSMFIAFLVIIVAPLRGVTSFWIYLGLITFPWFIKAFLILHKNFNDPVKMSPANMLTIRIHNSIGILLIIAFVIHGGLIGRNIYQMWFPLVILIILYLPVALTVFFNVMSLKPAGK